ncbi:MAG: SDR family NAD(P)-dependent oxidoreductase [Isosphaeraceae bacterium]|nr:SDR family NAD(P)-dependent oxidoreductase [Isosphaeraceae bacterium]
MARIRSLARSRCLVTGASSGLGRALAIALAAEGADLVLTARNRGRLDDVAARIRSDFPNAPEPQVVVADLTDEADRLRLVDAVQDRRPALDLLVNSAGVGANGPFETHDPSVLRRIFDLNVVALAELCRLCLPMLARGASPTILNLGSIVARRGLPGRAAYSASKFAVAGFSESIRAEWAKYGIHVLLVNPGFTATEFEANLLADTSRFKVTDRRTARAEDVAARAVRALKQGKHELTLTGEGRLLLAVNRLAPRLVDLGFARWIRRLYPETTAAESSAVPRPRIAEPRAVGYDFEHSSGD